MDGLLKVLLLLATAAVAWWLLRPLLPSFRHRIGDWRVHFALRRSLPASHYSVLRNLTLKPDSSGQAVATQIAHVVTSPYGIFVIETESSSGRISGGATDSDWTSRHFHAARTFRNPLRRNRSQVRVLQDLLGLDASRFHSLVVFTGRAEFTSVLPPNITQLGGLLPFIQVRTSELLGYEEAERVASLLESNRLPPGAQSAAAHLAALRETHGSRLSAKQAILGLGMMAVLLIAAGSLVHRLAEMPAQYPSPEEGLASSPFVENAPPPRIDLPGIAGPGKPGLGKASAVAGSTATGHVAKDLNQLGATRRVQQSQATLDQRLAWESSLKCAYSAESRRCSCYEPQGRKAEMEYNSCKALADRTAVMPRK